MSLYRDEVDALRHRIESVESELHATRKELATPVAALAARGPILLAFVIDSRPSMAPHLDQAAASIPRLVNAMRDDDRIAILQTSGAGSNVVLPISSVASVRTSLPGVLRELRPGPPSRWERGAVSAGIHAGMDLMQRSMQDARVVVVTDGGDVGWDLAESAAGYAAGQGFRVSALAVGDFVDGYPQSIARAGHGHFADLRVQTAFDEFITEELKGNILERQESSPVGKLGKTE